MSKLEEAKRVLNELKVLTKQQSDLCGYVIFAMADIKRMMNGLVQLING